MKEANISANMMFSISNSYNSAQILLEPDKKGKKISRVLMLIPMY